MMIDYGSVYEAILADNREMQARIATLSAACDELQMQLSSEKANSEYTEQLYEDALQANAAPAVTGVPLDIADTIDAALNLMWADAALDGDFITQTSAAAAQAWLSQQQGT